MWWNTVVVRVFIFYYYFAALLEVNFVDCSFTLSLTNFLLIWNYAGFAVIYIQQMNKIIILPVRFLSGGFFSSSLAQYHHCCTIRTLISCYWECGKRQRHCLVWWRNLFGNEWKLFCLLHHHHTNELLSKLLLVVGFDDWVGWHSNVLIVV